MKLHRTVEEKLRLKELIAIGVGGMIGGGIFSVLGISVSFAGNGAPLSFLIDVLIALTAGYHYVKLALTFRDDGASYTFLRRAFPQKPWIAGVEGWMVITGYIGTLALYAFTFGAYCANLLSLEDVSFVRAGLSVLILALLFYINLRGVRTSGITEDFIVYGKIFILALFAVVGFAEVDWHRFSPPANKGVVPIFLGSAVIFVAYEGFQLITNAVLETQEPDKDIPRGIYGSILITGAIYIALCIVAVGTLSYREIVSAKEYALAEVAQPILGNSGRFLVGIAAMMATSSAINSTLFGACRMMAEMAQEGMMPRIFSRRNKKGVPHVALIALTLFSLLFTAFGTLNVIAEFSSLTFLLVSIGVSIANIKLRSLTGANINLAITGLVLMAITSLTIVIYLLLKAPEEVLAIAGIYIAVALSFLLYRRSTTLSNRL